MRGDAYQAAAPSCRLSPTGCMRTCMPTKARPDLRRLHSKGFYFKCTTTPYPLDVSLLDDGLGEDKHV